MKLMATSPFLHAGSGAGMLLLSFLLIFSGCRKFDRPPKQLRHFDQVNLVDNNGAYKAPLQDGTLLNPWGLAFNTGGVAWISSQAGHVSQVYNKDGGTLRAPVNIPSPAGPTGGNPTGIVFYGGTTDFLLTNGAPARFIFVGVDGVLSAWNSGAGANALLLKNNSAVSAYTGLTLGINDGANYLYAADFRAGKIEVWDKNFTSIAMNFKDPKLPAGYHPFNIQSVGEWLYVLYAKVGSDGKDQPGLGLGLVSIFKTNGDFVKRFASRGALNAPWGIAQAPASFFDDMENMDDEYKKGDHYGAKNILLVGNFGDGRINAYTDNGDFLGALSDKSKPIVIDGLWAISFPPSTAVDIDPNRLYFTAGPNEEKDGIFGYIIKE